MDKGVTFPRLVAQVVFNQLFAFDPRFSCAYATEETRNSRSSSAHPSGAERRQLIARCRVLRADIRKFEEEFEAQTGRKPHSADRQQIVGVYTEYRKLKTVVRDNAATHIQAVWRGYRCRRHKLRKPHSSTTKGNAAAGEKLSQLRAEKSSLKSKLRAFDVKFAAEHGRNPAKSDKEHLRPLYQRYHDLKAMITTLEGALQSGGGDHRAKPSSRSASDAGEDDVDDFRSSADQNPHETLEHAGLVADLVGEDAGRSDAKTEAIDPATLAAAGTAAGLKDLRHEKRKLQMFLRNYEKDFEEKEGRKVKYVKDIAPVLTEYTRYKHVKAVLKELQGGSK